MLRYDFMVKKIYDSINIFRWKLFLYAALINLFLVQVADFGVSAQLTRTISRRKVYFLNFVAFAR